MRFRSPPDINGGTARSAAARLTVMPSVPSVVVTADERSTDLSGLLTVMVSAMYRGPLCVVRFAEPYPAAPLAIVLSEQHSGGSPLAAVAAELTRDGFTVIPEYPPTPYCRYRLAYLVLVPTPSGPADTRAVVLEGT